MWVCRLWKCIVTELAEGYRAYYGPESAGAYRANIVFTPSVVSLNITTPAVLWSWSGTR